MTKKNVVSRKCLALSRPLKFHADLVTFTEEILDGKLHFLYSVLERTKAAF